MMPSKPQFVGGRETVKLSEIAKIKAGNVAPKKDAFTEDGIPFVRAGSLTNLLAGGSLADLEKIDCGTAKKLRLTLFPAGTVVFAKSGMSCMTGNVYVLPEPCYVVSHLACVIPNGNYASYLKHYFRFNRPNRLIENPSFPSIKLSKIQGIELRLPSPEEVVKQVQAIERIESQIEQAKALFTYLDSLVKSRFVAMFGDPAGVTAKQRLVSIGSFTDVQTGATPLRKEPKYYGGSIPWVKTGEVARNFSNGVEESITDIAIRETNCKVFPAGTILVAMYGQGDTRGKAAILPFEAATNQACAAIVPSPSHDESFLNAQLQLLYEKMRARSLGGNQKNLSLGIIKSMKVLLPSMEAQNEFADFVAQVDKSRFLHQASAKVRGNKLQSSFTSDIGSTFSRRLSLQEGLTLG